MVAPRVYHGEYTLQETVILTQLNLNIQARDLERMTQLNLNMQARDLERMHQTRDFPREQIHQTTPSSFQQNVPNLGYHAEPLDFQESWAGRPLVRTP